LVRKGKAGFCKGPASNPFGTGNEVGFSEMADMKPPKGIKPLRRLFYTPLS
jgi:hypothetical protein